ncbi:hypothetical protein FACS1894130_00150 [Spirochaetia bacterium]|nr:hypothetical protein FACS1894130_00150 [Spirochaetia bacterium]
MTNIKRRVFQVLWLSVMVFFFFGFYDSFLSKYRVKKNLNYILETYATDGSKECPIAIGKEMIMEKVSFIAEKTIRYEFRLLNVDSFGIQESKIQEFKQKMSEIDVKNLKMNKSLAKLQNNDIIFEHLYFDNQGEKMFNIRVLFNTPIKIID